MIEIIIGILLASFLLGCMLGYVATGEILGGMAFGIGGILITIIMIIFFWSAFTIANELGFSFWGSVAFALILFFFFEALGMRKEVE